MNLKNCLITLSLLAMLSACAFFPSEKKATLRPVGFSDLDGWHQDDQGAALAAFKNSCAVLLKKNEMAGPKTNMLGDLGLWASWQKTCKKADNISPDAVSARQFFEENFQPYRIQQGGEESGLFTGYYEATLYGAMLKTQNYQTPLYALPHDLAVADLGDFYPDLKGKKITARVMGRKLIPFDDRAAITKGSLNDRADVLAYVSDPVDAFFLSIQGSGRVMMPDGAVLRVGYDGANGQPYVAIGKKLLEGGKLDRPVTMEKIRAYLAAHPGEAAGIMNQNPSYIFFKKLDGDNVGPLGAMGVPLTPMRSLAVDPDTISLGAPMWLNTVDGFGNVFNHLMVAQDTGGAIKGVVRGDVFWGAGKEAEAQAGSMQSQGRYVILLPK